MSYIPGHPAFFSWTNNPAGPTTSSNRDRFLVNQYQAADAMAAPIQGSMVQVLYGLLFYLYLR